MFDVAELFKNMADKSPLDAQALHRELKEQHLQNFSRVPSQFSTQDLYDLGVKRGWIVRDTAGNFEVVVP